MLAGNLPGKQVGSPQENTAENLPLQVADLHPHQNLLHQLKNF